VVVCRGTIKSNGQLRIGNYLFCRWTAKGRWDDPCYRGNWAYWECVSSGIVEEGLVSAGIGITRGKCCVPGWISGGNFLRGRT